MMFYLSILAICLAIVALLRRPRLPRVIELNDGRGVNRLTISPDGIEILRGNAVSMMMRIDDSGIASVVAAREGASFRIALKPENVSVVLQDGSDIAYILPNGVTLQDAAETSVLLPSGTLDKLPLSAGQWPMPHPDAKRLVGPKPHSPIEPLRAIEKLTRPNPHGLKLHQPNSEDHNASESPSIA